MSHFKSILCLAVLLSLTLAIVSASRDAGADKNLSSKLRPESRSRTARSLSDYFEKVKSKIFGKKSQPAAVASSSVSQQSSSAANAAVQRQPWEMNSMSQQYNPYSSISSGNYQWPAGSQFAVANQQYGSQQAYNPMSAFGQSASSGQSVYPSSGSQSSGLAGIMGSGLDASGMLSAQSVINPAVNSAAGSAIGSASGSGSSTSSSSGGLLSSASHLISQYLSPSSSSSIGSTASASPQSQQQAQSPFTPQQQSQYNEFASIIDSMVAQTGAAAPQQRQPMASSQFGQQQSIQQQSQQQQFAAMGQPTAGTAGMMGDVDMSASNNIQSYMPVASQQQASQKSSMESLVDQLAPGAKFNKLITFPFHLSNNDDPSKGGRFKLEIPYLNQHVKRSDQQQPVRSSYYQAQAQQQQYPVYLQQAQQQPIQMMAQASQVVPSIVSPQQSASQIAAIPSSVSSSSSVSQISQQQPSAISSIQAPSNSRQVWSTAADSPAVSPSASSSPNSSSPVSSSSSSSSTSSSSVSSSSKLIPIQSSSSVDASVGNSS